LFNYALMFYSMDYLQAIRKKRSEQFQMARVPQISLWAHKECYFCPLFSVSQISSSIFQGLTPLSFHTPEIVALVLPWVLQIPAGNAMRSDAMSQHQKLFGFECCKWVSDDRGLRWHSFTG
uniref:Uncharacterized protein n=1 Tax=Zosterops lateralis melanops TaxID=1220523 RepID=A0A8D2PIS6_ZOSLA